MRITINGKERDVQEGLTVAGLLIELKINPRGTAVEIDREIIPRAEHGERAIKDGEAIEIIRMVGGG